MSTSPNIARQHLDPLCALLMALLCVGLSSEADALTFDVEFRDSTYATQAGDTYDDLVLAHQAGTLRTTLQISGIDGLSSVASAGTNQDYSTWITTTFTAAISGDYTFQIGTDWGRGGASKAVDLGTNGVLDEFVTADDIWWNLDWNNPDVLTTALTLQQGESYHLGWVGFEGCCGGSVTFRFSVDGAPFSVLDDGNFAPFETVPEPGSGLLVAAGLVGLGTSQRARRLRVMRRS